MPIKNETLRKKLESKRDKLREKIQPWQDELDLTEKMLDQMDAYEAKQHMDAEAKLGIYSKASDEKVTHISIEEVA